MRGALLFCLLLCACAHGTRRLSEEERLKLGLTGIAYDIPLCPTAFDETARESRVNGPCELVTCEQKGGKIECTASPAPPMRK